MKRRLEGGWLGVWGLFLLLALAQQVRYPPSFGPYEDLRRQAHAQCQGYVAQGGQAYVQCLQQMAVSLCGGPYAPRMDALTGVACMSAVFAGYPAPGKPVLNKPSYRVELAGGVQRERDVRTGQVVRQERVQPGLLFTLERKQQGLYRGTMYDPQGRPQTVYWVSASCELLDQDGRPAMDGWACPMYPNKPYLLQLQEAPVAGLPPNAQFFFPGRLADDFDGDGVVEIGYMATGGSGGRAYTSGWVRALGYDPNTRLLKYEYRVDARESKNAYTSYALEALILYRVR
ncbi:hypothetical protein KZX47_01095 [Thermus sp. SYSU G05001]|uniref:DUF4377 domain-containing protein n=1 Tax=Thermus brevis TaxID=2862456 RepID=A0ABS6ZUM3_9DEIN|nr:hypothetical protein [Thermus brevis]MBW6393759.1 hypothetical protein [Thermus brevis]